MFETVAVLLVACFVSAFLYFECRKFIVNRNLKGFAIPKHVPILGVANRFFGKSNDELLEIFNELFSEVPTSPIQAWFGYQLVIIESVLFQNFQFLFIPVQVIGIADPISLQIVLNAEQCTNKPYPYQYMHCVTSIIATDIDVWRPHRRALNTAFNLKVLTSYVPKINGKAAVLVDQLDSMASENSAIDLYSMVFRCLVDIISSTTMGVEMNMQSPRGELVQRATKVVMANIQRRFVHFWLYWDFIYRLTPYHRKELWAVELGEQLMKHMRDTKVDEINRQNYDILEMGRRKNTLNVIEKCLLLQREGKFSEQIVFDQMRVIFIAGIDTSSIAIFSTILLLAIHQQHQDKVVEELADLFETADCDVTYDHLSKMTFLECAIKEALRLFPPAPILARTCSDDVEICGGKIPKGTQLLINIAHLHRNEKYWGSQADRFDPERFLPQNSAGRPAYSYLPFCGGPRNCIGMKYAYVTAKIVVAHLLRRYKFTSDLKMEDIRTKLHVVLEISNENPVKIERRMF